jgi:hypothetical protein
MNPSHDDGPNAASEPGGISSLENRNLVPGGGRPAAVDAVRDCAARVQRLESEMKALRCMLESIGSQAVSSSVQRD